MIVESAWTMIRHDSVMAAAYGEYCKRMKSQEAVIRIARKLSNRILKILRSGQNMNMTGVISIEYKSLLGKFQFG